MKKNAKKSSKKDDSALKQRQLEQEKNELNTLINSGYSFEVEDYVPNVKRKYLFGLFKRYTPVKTMKRFTIKEPTLGTLDRLAAIWIDFEIDELSLKEKEAMHTARTLAHRESTRCAKVVAIAVLGSDYLVPVAQSNSISYKADDKQLESLTALFARTIKPSQLLYIVMMINAMCNLGDFTNSIRLMSADRETMPIRIEEQDDNLD